MRASGRLLSPNGLLVHAPRRVGPRATRTALAASKDQLGEGASEGEREGGRMGGREGGREEAREGGSEQAMDRARERRRGGEK